MESNDNFSYELLIQYFKEANESEDPLILPISAGLHEMTKLFAKLGKVMSMAFADVKEKSDILKQLSEKYEKRTMFSLLELEVEAGIEKLNGDNNKKQTTDKTLHKYISGARTMLRMMWFMDYLYTMFSQIAGTDKKMSAICLDSYNIAFGEKHTFIIRQGAKIGMKTVSNRESIAKHILNKSEVSKEEVEKVSKEIAECIYPLKEKLWKYYREKGYDSLP